MLQNERNIRFFFQKKREEKEKKKNEFHNDNSNCLFLINYFL